GCTHSAFSLFAPDRCMLF
ncbi:Os01g0920400, partial [Oryza sativa Japonica Group]